MKCQFCSEEDSFDSNTPSVLPWEVFPAVNINACSRCFADIVDYKMSLPEYIEWSNVASAVEMIEGVRLTQDDFKSREEGMPFDDIYKAVCKYNTKGIEACRNVQKKLNDWIKAKEKE